MCVMYLDALQENFLPNLSACPSAVPTADFGNLNMRSLLHVLQGLLYSGDPKHPNIVDQLQQFRESSQNAAQANFTEIYTTN